MTFTKRHGCRTLSRKIASSTEVAKGYSTASLQVVKGYPLSTLTITLLFQFPGLNGCFSLWLRLWLVVARLYSPKRPLINSAPDVFGQSQPVFLGRGPPFGQVRALDAQA